MTFAEFHIILLFTVSLSLSLPPSLLPPDEILIVATCTYHILTTKLKSSSVHTGFIKLELALGSLSIGQGDPGIKECCLLLTLFFSALLFLCNLSELGSLLGTDIHLCTD